MEKIETNNTVQESLEYYTIYGDILVVYDLATQRPFKYTKGKWSWMPKKDFEEDAIKLSEEKYNTLFTPKILEDYANFIKNPKKNLPLNVESELEKIFQNQHNNKEIN